MTISDAAAALPLSAPQPLLHTPRLLLRPFRLSDAQAVERLAGDRRVAEMTMHIQHPYPAGGGSQWIESLDGIWERGDGVTYGVTHTETGDLLGAVGLSVSATHARGEIGYWLGVPYWNAGYTTEAARAVLALGFGTLGLHRIQAHHIERNPASGRIMQKLGMTREGIHRGLTRKWGQFEDVVSYAILDDEWATQHAVQGSE